jgi:hypothetical protein
MPGDQEESTGALERDAQMTALLQYMYGIPPTTVSDCRHMRIGLERLGLLSIVEKRCGEEVLWGSCFLGLDQRAIAA